MHRTWHILRGIRRAFLLLSISLSVSLLLVGQVFLVPVTLADIAGDGTAHAIASSGSARSITFVSLSSNSTANCNASATSGCVRVGDSSVSTTRGIPLAPGQGYGLLESSGAARYQLSAWFYVVQTGDKISISYVQ